MTPRWMYCIFNTPCRICCKARALFRVESRDALDESNGADGDQILLIVRLCIVFLNDVGHQPEIVLHQPVPSLQIPLRPPLQTRPLLLRQQRPGERTGIPRQTQGQKQAVGQQ